MLPEGGVPGGPVPALPPGPGGADSADSANSADPANPADPAKSAELPQGGGELPQRADLPVWGRILFPGKCGLHGKT